LKEELRLNKTGPVVDFCNLIRRQLGMNYGQRTQYDGIQDANGKYIKFNGPNGATKLSLRFKMKTIIIIFLILINYNLIGQCRDSLIDIRYIKAFEYISNSSELTNFLSNEENLPNNLKFFISPSLQYFRYTLFDEEIVKKKYNISIRTSGPLLNQVYDSLRAIDLRYNFYSDTLCILTKLSTQENSKIIVYFSKIFGNTLISAVF
jgi:hypothetical protein